MLWSLLTFSCLGLIAIGLPAQVLRLRVVSVADDAGPRRLAVPADVLVALGVAGITASLANDVLSPGPVTRAAVLLISAKVACVLVTLMAFAATKVLERLLVSINRTLYSVAEATSQLTGRVTSRASPERLDAKAIPVRRAERQFEAAVQAMD